MSLRVKGAWEERYEATCDRWRGLLDEVVYAFLDCGDLHRGFARVFCDSCHREDEAPVAEVVQQ